MDNGHDKPSYEQLEAICKRLQEQVGKGISLQQELINAKNEREEELDRFYVMQQYGQAALKARTLEELASLTVEYFVEAYKQPRTALFTYQHGRLQLLGQFGFRKNALPAVVDFQKVYIEDLGRQCVFLHEHPLLHDKFAFCKFKEAFIAPFFDEAQQLSGIIVSGHTVADALFYDPLEVKMCPSFTTMTQNMGLYYQNLRINQFLKEEIKQREAVEQELRTSQVALQTAKQELEKRVEDRTNHLKNTLFKLQQEIEDRKMVEKELEEQTKELRRSNADLEQFAYVASHDLKTPLRNVASFAELLERRYRHKLDEAGLEYLDFIIKGTKKFNNIINDLLRYSRVSKGSMTVENVKMDRLVEGVLIALCNTIAETNADITTDDLPQVKASGQQLIQLFQNLLENALKFRRADRAPIIHIGYQAQPTHHLFTVTDNGIGIDPRFEHKIFTLFQRLHTDEQYEGTGLGLSICKKIVERHEGEIWFSPNPDGGAIFHFTLKKDLFKLGH